MSEQDTPRRRRPLRLVLLVLVPALVLAGAGYVYLTGGGTVGTENAYVRADIVNVAPQVSGRVVAVPVSGNQPVSQGDLLFRIDPQPYRLAVQRARARLESVGDELAALKAQYRAAQAELALARGDVDYAAKERTRQERLARTRVVPQQKSDAAEHEWQQARQRVQALEQQLARLAAQLDGGLDAPVEAHPRYREAKAAVEAAELDLAHTEVRAPADGVAGKVKVLTGSFAAAGQPAVSLVQTGYVWIEANLKETQLTHLREGQEATVVVDAYPDRPLRARVTSLSPATGSEYALLPAQNATGNWVKVVQRVPVKLALEDEQAPPLRAGMSAEVEVHTGYRRSLAGLFGGDAVAAPSE